jgi:hypothetical protein
LAKQVNINKGKSNFRRQKTLPTPNFATAKGQTNYRRYKKAPGAVKFKQGAAKKAESKKEKVFENF